jgi:hypothetical protein
VRLRRGIKALVITLSGITRSEVGRRGVARGDRRKRPGSADVVGKTQLTSGASLIERRGRGGRLGKMRTEKENVFPAKTRPTHGLDGPAENQEKRNFRIKIGFLNLPRLWKFVEGDLGGILT